MREAMCSYNVAATGGGAEGSCCIMLRAYYESAARSMTVQRKSHQYSFCDTETVLIQFYVLCICYGLRSRLVCTHEQQCAARRGMADGSLFEHEPEDLRGDRVRKRNRPGVDGGGKFAAIPFGGN
jgi:hypothetical protein